MGHLARHGRIVAEPSGAVTFAAWLCHAKELPASEQAVAVVSGGNLDPQLLAQVLTEAPHPGMPRGHRLRVG
jgi:threonine dehydratase